MYMWGSHELVMSLAGMSCWTAMLDRAEPDHVLSRFVSGLGP